MQRTLLSLFFFFSGCSWFHQEHIVIAAHGITFSDTYFSARLIEKLKNVDGAAIKDPSLVQTFKSALTEELVVEAALYAWAQKNNISFNEKELNAFLREQVGNSLVPLKEVVSEAQPSLNLLRDAIYIQMIQSRLIDSYAAQTAPSEGDLKVLFENYKKKWGRSKLQIRQIIVREEHEAETLMSSIKSGKTSFETAEKMFSLLRDFKPDEELPWIDSHDSSFFAPLEKAPVGLFSRVLKSHVGYHIIKIVRIKKDAAQSFAALRPALEVEYKKKRGYELYLQWLHEHVKKDAVVIDEKRLRSMTAEYQETFQ